MAKLYDFDYNSKREIIKIKAPEPMMVDEGWGYRKFGGCSKGFTVQEFYKD